jgi:signal peptidase II
MLADRVTKEIALRTLADTSRGGGVFRLVTSGRPRLAREASKPTLVAVWLAAVACALAGLAVSPSLRANPLVSVGVAVALAGAACNGADLLARGAVVDFIAIGWWPVFNLADAAIVVGAGVAALSLA